MKIIEKLKMSQSEPLAERGTHVLREANIKSENSTHLNLPNPIVTRRTRTDSTSAKASKNQETGKVKIFCREKGHGFITSDITGEDVFVHISDIEGEFVPLPGDEVEFRLCPIPPKYEKYQAVHVKIVNLTPEVHVKWDT